MLCCECSSIPKQKNKKQKNKMEKAKSKSVIGTCHSCNGVRILDMRTRLFRT